MKIFAPIFVSALISWGGLPAIATEKQEILSIVTDRKEAVYALGEAIKFDIGSADSGLGELKWTLSHDGVTPQQTGTVQLKEGRATIEGRMDQPGFLRLTIRGNAGGKPFKALGAAAVAPEKIAHGVPAPDDFDTFWVGQKKLLQQVPMHDKRVSVPLEKYPTVEIVDLKITALGAPVSGYYGKPIDAKVGAHPAILLLHGAGVRGAVAERAGEWAAQGAIALDINAHGLPNGESAEFYKKLQKDYLSAYSYRSKVSREHHYFVGMVLRVLRAIDFLAAQPEWNGRLAVFGSSQGGAQSIYGAGLDERVGFIAAGVPAYADVTGYRARRAPGWPAFVYDAKQQIMPDVVEIARYFDIVNFIRRTKADAIYTVSFLDVVTPPDTIYSLYNEHQGVKAIHHDPLFGHTNTPEGGKAMRLATRRYLFAK